MADSTTLFKRASHHAGTDWRLDEQHGAPAGGGMKVEQSFTVARPIDDVWAFFQRIPEVAACLPGAEMTAEKAPGIYTGKVSLKLGPFGASFDGEAAVQFDQPTQSGRVEGKGVDRRGGSRSRMTVAFALTAPTPQSTTVRMDADVTLSGAIAQFGRTGIINETTKILIGDFVARVEQRLTPVAPAHEPAVPPAHEPPVATAHEPTVANTPQLNLVRMIWLGVKAWLARLFGHQA